jgi:hypothetical protein
VDRCFTILRHVRLQHVPANLPLALLVDSARPPSVA